GQEGTTRLLDYRSGAAAGPAVLVVPSLINRAYILDLTAETSLMRFLAGAGCEPFLVDWQAPGKVERGFTLTDYVAGRLEAAPDQGRGGTARPVGRAGYLMGGALGLGAVAGDPPRGRPRRRGLPGDPLGLPCRAAGAGAPAGHRRHPVRARDGGDGRAVGRRHPAAVRRTRSLPGDPQVPRLRRARRRL